MIPLRKKVNAIAPGGAFVNGDLKDDPGDESGVPTDRELLDDQAQFFESIMQLGEEYASIPTATIAQAQTVANNFTGRNYINPQIDNGTTIAQLLSAFLVAIGIRIQNFIATQTQVNTGTDNVNYVTSLTFVTGWLYQILNTAVTGIGTSVSVAIIALKNQMASMQNQTVILGFDSVSFGVAGGDGSLTSGNLTYNINPITKIVTVGYNLTTSGFTGGTPTSFALGIPSITWKTGSSSYNIGYCDTITSGSNLNTVGITNDTTNHIVITPITGAFTTSASIIEGSFTGFIN